jgi:Ribonuclease H2 non-catalytic subunit (Ylr154p-like)
VDAQSSFPTTTLVLYVLDDVDVGHVYRTVYSTSGLHRMRYGDEEDAEDEDTEKITWRSTGSFDRFAVWEHHMQPEASEDNWIRGVEEWIVMAEAVHRDLSRR